MPRIGIGISPSLSQIAGAIDLPVPIDTYDINLATYQSELASLFGVTNPGTATGTITVDFTAAEYQTELENRI